MIAQKGSRIIPSDGFTGLLAPGRHGTLNQLQHRRVRRVEQMRHPVVSAVHGQRVLHQIIRANAEKTHAPGQPVRHQRRRGNFNHHADFHLPMEGNARRVQFRFAFFQQLV